MDLLWFYYGNTLDILCQTDGSFDFGPGNNSPDRLSTGYHQVRVNVHSGVASAALSGLAQGHSAALCRRTKETRSASPSPSASAYRLLNHRPSPESPKRQAGPEGWTGLDLSPTLRRDGGNLESHPQQTRTHAAVAGVWIAAKGRANFIKNCPPDKTVKMPPDGHLLNPCAEFEGVSLVDRAQFAMMPPQEHEGYNALPLGGVWARAPYLHNGSVPTLYHLLVPDERPLKFIKSRLDYDPQRVGFAWEIDAGATDEGYPFDTGAFPALSNKGHDTDIQEDGKEYRLDWSTDKESARALIEYLKTL